jgi:hypothetical protein
MGNTSCADANRVAILRTRALTSGESMYGYQLCREGCPSQYYQGISMPHNRMKLRFPHRRSFRLFLVPIISQFHTILTTHHCYQQTYTLDHTDPDARNGARIVSNGLHSPSHIRNLVLRLPLCHFLTGYNLGAQTPVSVSIVAFKDEH